MKKNGNKGGFAFLGKSWVGFITILIISIGLLITQKVLDYKYIVIQKKVQEGDLTLWHEFLTISIVSAILFIICHLIFVFSQIWIERVQKFNAFERYDGIVQQEGKIKAFLNVFEYAKTKVNAIVEVTTAIISIVYTLFLLEIVQFTIPQIIGAILILVLDIGFGIVRGTLQQKIDSCRSDIGARQQLLSNHFMPSSDILKERLKMINMLYWKNLAMQMMKNFFQKLPELIKVICFVGFMWEIVESFNYSGEETVYSYSYIIFTAYGFIVSVANDLGNIFESVTKLIKFSKDKSIRFLNDFENARDKDLLLQSENIFFEKGIVIKKEFTAKVIKKDKSMAKYYLPSDLKIEKGKTILLDGNNGLGKSRFTQLIYDLVPQTLWYNPKSEICDIFIENFIGKFEIDYDLISSLASGLGLQRIPEKPEDIEELTFKEPLNGADRQLLIALQILYFAIKEHEDSDNTQLVILDEVLANVSPENVPKVIAFIQQELEKIGACTIFITHAHKSYVYEYIDEIWKMSDEGDKIKIEPEKVN